MKFPSETELPYTVFEKQAQAQFPEADDATLQALYPMVLSLRQLAASVSGIMLHFDEDTLSNTATGKPS